MKVKYPVIFMTFFLLSGLCLVSADDFIHLKNGRVIGVKKFRYENGWIIMELPGGGEIGTLESEVADVEKSTISLADYKPREAVEYKDSFTGDKRGRGGTEMFMDEGTQAINREQRRREMRERYDQMRRGNQAGEGPKDEENILDDRSPFDQNTKEQREEQIRKMEEEMKRKSGS